MGICRTIAAIYLALFGLLGLLCLPMIRDPLLDYLRSSYPNITWNADPHPVANMFLCLIAIVSAVGIYRRRQWALWLGTVVLVAEIFFTTDTLAHDFSYDQHGSILTAFLWSAAFNAFFIFMLRPWRRWHVPVAQQEVRMKTAKTKKLRMLLPFIVLAGLVVMGYLGYREASEETKKGKGIINPEIDLKSGRTKTYTRESLEKEIERLRRENARLSKEILDESVKMAFFVNSEESDSLIRRYGNDLTSAMPALKSMIKGTKRDKIDAVICLGKMGIKNQANAKTAKPLLLEALKDNERVVRTLAATMLIRLGEKTEAIDILLNTLTNRPDTEELLYAVGGLMEAEVSVKDYVALTILKASLTNEDPSIVLFSARILVNSHCCYNLVILRMLNLLKSPQRDLRDSAATIFWLMGPNAKSALPSVKAARLAETDNEVAGTLTLAIAAMEGD